MRCETASLALLLTGGCFAESEPVTPQTQATESAPGDDGGASETDAGKNAGPGPDDGTTTGAASGGDGSGDTAPADDASSSSPWTDSSSSSGSTFGSGSETDAGSETAALEGTSSSGDTTQLEGSSTDGFDASSSTGTSALEHTIFITDAVVSANLGGLAGADAICEAAGAATGVDGPWLAVLADTNQPLSDRIEILGPVIGVDGAMINDNAEDFFTGIADVAVSATQTGGIPQDTVAWVGSADHDCAAWSSSSAAVFGQQALSTQLDGWLYGTSAGPCSLSRSLYCISQ